MKMNWSASRPVGSAMEDLRRGGGGGGGEGDLPACPQETGLSSLVKGILGLKAWGGKSGPGVGATGSSWVLSIKV